MLKRLICIILILSFIILTTMAIYASTETGSSAVVKLTRVEGLKNTLGVQKLDIRVNGLDGYRITEATDFESVYFSGEEILNVDDITKFKVNTCVLTSTWKWYANLTSLVEGENEITLEIKKNNKVFKMIVVVVVDYPDTSSTIETTSTIDTTTIADTSTPDSTITGDITPTISDTTTPEATTTPAVIDEDNLPHTGESSPIAIYIIGITIVSVGIFLFRKFVLN